MEIKREKTKQNKKKLKIRRQRGRLFGEIPSGDTFSFFVFLGGVEKRLGFGFDELRSLEMLRPCRISS